MLSVPCLFKKDGNGVAYNEVVEGFEWALSGGVMTTRKFAGEICYIQNGKLFKNDDTPVLWNIPEDAHYADAFAVLVKQSLRNLDRYYLLCGPAIAEGRSNLRVHTLIPYVGLPGRVPDLSVHANYTELSFLSQQPMLTFDLLRSVCGLPQISGVVFHHPDGRVAEITREDFGIPSTLPGELSTPEQMTVVL